jgi:hypothetical protein
MTSRQRYPAPTKEQVDEAWTVYQLGSGLGRTARKVGLQIHQLQAAFKERGYKLRERKESMRASARHKAFHLGSGDEL